MLIFVAAYVRKRWREPLRRVCRAAPGTQPDSLWSIPFRTQAPNGGEDTAPGGLVAPLRQCRRRWLACTLGAASGDEAEGRSNVAPRRCQRGGRPPDRLGRSRAGAAAKRVPNVAVVRKPLRRRQELAILTVPRRPKREILGEFGQQGRTQSPIAPGTQHSTAS